MQMQVPPPVTDERKQLGCRTSNSTAPSVRAALCTRCASISDCVSSTTPAGGLGDPSRLSGCDPYTTTFTSPADVTAVVGCVAFASSTSMPHRAAAARTAPS